MPQSTLQTANELIAGSFGGAAQVLVGQPLDTIKTRAQIAPSSVTLSPPASMCQTNHLTPFAQRTCLSVLFPFRCHPSSEPALQKGPMDILAQTMRKEGVLALYKGFAPPRLPYHLSVSHRALTTKGWPVPSSGSQVSTLCSLPPTDSRNGSSPRLDNSP